MSTFNIHGAQSASLDPEAKEEKENENENCVFFELTRNAIPAKEQRRLVC
jgi:hypothetical protein